MPNNDEIQHHGILGMRWGIRRYQNPDGSLTDAGRRRAQKLKNEFNLLTGKKLKGKISDDKPLDIKSMSDKELKDKITRLTNERTLEGLINQNKPTQVPRESFAKKLWKEVALPSILSAGKDNLTKYLTKAGADAMGLNKKVLSKSEKLKKDATDAQNAYNIAKWQNELKKLNQQSSNSQNELKKINQQSSNSQNNSKKENYEKKIYDLLKSQSSNSQSKEYTKKGKQTLTDLFDLSPSSADDTIIGPKGQGW